MILKTKTIKYIKIVLIILIIILILITLFNNITTENYENPNRLIIKDDNIIISVQNDNIIIKDGKDEKGKDKTKKIIYLGTDAIIITSQLIYLGYDIIIVGCANNIEKYLSTTRIKLDMIISLFKSCKIIIYENDSTDKTLDILTEWKDNNFIELITQKNVSGIRTEVLANARNLLYKEAMQYTFDLLIVMEFDNIIEDLTKEGIVSCFKLQEDWAMLGANQTEYYYDLISLRTIDDWLPYDIVKCQDIDQKSYDECMGGKYRNIYESSPPIEVLSCYGGIAIYKKIYLNNCNYGKGVQMYKSIQLPYSEHVDFNKCVTNNGGKIYINPKLINCKGVPTNINQPAETQAAAN